MVTAKDMDILQGHLFVDDNHDYKHERARVQTGSYLSLFASSGARAGAAVDQVLIAIVMNVYITGFVFRSAFRFYRANRFSQAN